MAEGSGHSQLLAANAPPLLERDRELGAFGALLDTPGDSHLVVIEGPAGIGKSRLVAELRERGAERRRVLSAFGSDLERDFPFGVVRQLFEPSVADPGEGPTLLEGAAASARSVFAAVAEDEDRSGDGSFAVLHGLYWLAVNTASRGPLMLVVDDLHWCDRPSLRFLAYLIRRLEGLGALVVVGLRTAEPGTDPVLIAEIASTQDALYLQPTALSATAVATLIGDRLDARPEPEFVNACRTATGGNPLLMRQLLSSLSADGIAPEAAQVAAVQRVGPRAVSRSVLLRLHRLAAPAGAVAQAVAVLGNHAALAHVAALCGLTVQDAARATAGLAQAEILHADLPLRFVHPLVRDAVYHELPATERQLLHAQAADILSAARLAPEAIATQLLAAPRRGDPGVVACLRAAAASALSRGAADSAVAHLRRALDEPPFESERPAVLLELGLAETLTSGPDAAEHLRGAWETLTDPRQRAQVAAVLARTLLFTAPADEAVAVVGQALEQTPAELVDERQSLQALRLMAVFFGAGGEAEISRAGTIEIQGNGPGAKMLTAIVAHCLAMTGAGAERCLGLAFDALADGVLIAADPGLFPPAAIGVLLLADRDEALQAYDELREHAHREGSLLGILTVGLWRGVTLLWRGELREAEESFAQALQDFVSWGLIRAGETYGPAFFGAARLRRGNLAGARELLITAPIADVDTDGYRYLLRFRTELQLAEGRFEDALATARDLAGRLPSIVNPGWNPWRSLQAQALDGLGRTEEGLALVEEELAHAQAFGTPGMIGAVMIVRGRLRRSAGLDDLREAVALLEGTAARYDLARALFALGAALRQDRRPTEAREPLRRALEVADRCGAEGLVDQIRSELYAAGARPRATALDGVEALTASERRVVDLAAGGLSNKDIAQTLFVTPKTVEVHLSSAYRKLNIRSRQELGTALA